MNRNYQPVELGGVLSEVSGIAVPAEDHLAFSRAIKVFETELRRMASGAPSGGVWRFENGSAEWTVLWRAFAGLKELRYVFNEVLCRQIGPDDPYGKDVTKFYYGSGDPQP